MSPNNQPSARVLAHSVNAAGSELITFEITCHRWILAEINTHRMLSRNFRSSRAVPFTKLVHEVETNPAMPIEWLKNKPGMQATEPLTTYEQFQAQATWIAASRDAVKRAEELAATGMHKQWVNRILEPYLFVHGVISGTEWSNFYARRRHPDAQPEFKALADAMWSVHNASEPRLLGDGEWHLPYVTDEERANPEHLLPYYHLGPNELCRLSVSRVARVSYTLHTGENTNLATETVRHDKLLAAGHMSPFEHQARPRTDNEYQLDEGEVTIHNGLPTSNFNDSWVQYRKLIPGENITNYNPED